MKQQISNKFKTYSFWISVGGAVALVIQSLARAYGFAFNEEIVNDLITSVCGVLVVFGVISAPNGTGNAKLDLFIDKSDDDVTDTSESSDTDTSSRDNISSNGASVSLKNNKNDSSDKSKK